MDLSIDQSLVGYSDVLLSIAYHPFQLINRKTQLQHEKSLTKLIRLLIPSTSFLIFFVFTFLLYLVDLFLLFKSSHLRKFRIGRKLLHPNLRPRMVTISFVLFMFFIKSFFGNNMNTSTVILDYSDLLYSNQQLLRTTKEFWFLSKMFNNIPNWTLFDLPKEGGKDGYQTFLNLFEFLDEYTRVTALPLDRLDYFFRLCLALQCVLLFAQLTHYTLNKLLLIKRTYKGLRLV